MPLRSSKLSFCLRQSVVLLVASFLATLPLQAQTLTVLHSFTTDGRAPLGGLVRDGEGNLYGTTQNGGAASAGTVFKLDPSGKLTVLHSFTGRPDGSSPRAGLIMDAHGNLYGTTQSGGTGGRGTAFKVDSSGTETVLYSFTGKHGANPKAGLVMDGVGNLYGTTTDGGSAGFGDVFKIDTLNKPTVIHSFSGNRGTDPRAGLILDAAGNFYGTTLSGGSAGQGTVFKIDAFGTASVVHNFIGTDGSSPYGSLILDAAGNLYGTTCGGGSPGQGTVFKVDTSGTETVLHNFTGGNDGGCPSAGLVMDEAGNLYGTTTFGGSAGLGTVFKVDTSGMETVLHAFQGSAGGGDGRYPYAGLIMDKAGNLYGTTARGGSGNGTVFKISF